MRLSNVTAAEMQLGECKLDFNLPAGTSGPLSSQYRQPIFNPSFKENPEAEGLLTIFPTACRLHHMSSTLLQPANLTNIMSPAPPLNHLRLSAEHYRLLHNKERFCFD